MGSVTELSFTAGFLLPEIARARDPVLLGYLLLSLLPGGFQALPKTDLGSNFEG